MKKLKFLSILFLAGLTVGCATRSDVNHIQSQVDSIKADVNIAKTAATSAAETAKAAETRAAAAEKTAHRAERAAVEMASKINQYLDHRFVDHMKK